MISQRLRFPIRLRWMRFVGLICIFSPPSAQAKQATETTHHDLAGIALLERDGTTLTRPWRPFLASESAVVRRQALIAMARLRSSSHLGQISSKLADPSPAVRDAAAFAFSRIPGANTAQLYSRFGNETVTKVQIELIRSIGRIGTAEDAKKLTLKYSTADDELKPAILYSIAELNHRSGVSDTGFLNTLVKRFLKEPIIYERRAIMTVLRNSKIGPNELPVSLFEKCLTDQDSGVRQSCIVLIPATSPENQSLIEKCLQDNHLGVRIEAAKHLGRTNQHQILLKRLAQLFQTDTPWSSISTDTSTILDSLMTQPVGSIDEAIVSSVFRATQDRLFPKATAIVKADPDAGASPTAIVEKTKSDTMSSDMPQMIVGEINCASAALLDGLKKRVDKTQKCGGSGYPSERRVHWQISVIKKSRTALKQFRRLYSAVESPARVKIIEALVDYPASKDRDKMLSAALKGTDEVLIVSGIKAYVALQPTGYRQRLVDLYKDASMKRQYGVVATLFDAYSNLKIVETIPILERHADDARLVLKQSAARALKTLEAVLAEQSRNRGIQIEKGRRDRVPPPAFMADGEEPDLRLAQYAEFENALVYTTAGDILIKFYVADARESVKRFIALIKRGFFKKQRFFGLEYGQWIQSGDPTNTGLNVPGQLYRPEISQKRVKIGTIGLMPNVGGLDGTNWFISLVDKPNLDGRITVIGEVMDGLDIVYQLSPSDRIIRVELLSKR